MKVAVATLHQFARALNKPMPDVLFWVVAVVNCSREMPGVRLILPVIY